MTDAGEPWQCGDLVAVDLEGLADQIVEVALVPLHNGEPNIADSFTSLVKPRGPVPRQPWISPGITERLLRQAPAPGQVAAEIAHQVNGKYLVGHNVAVDWRLLRRQYPALTPAGLIDTLRLGRRHHPQPGHTLADWVDRLKLADAINAAVPDGQPHRALWDAVAAAFLLSTLIAEADEVDQSLLRLLSLAGVPLSKDERPGASQAGLW